MPQIHTEAFHRVRETPRALVRDGLVLLGTTARPFLPVQCSGLQIGHGIARGPHGV